MEKFKQGDLLCNNSVKDAYCVMVSDTRAVWISEPWVGHDFNVIFWAWELMYREEEYCPGKDCLGCDRIGHVYKLSFDYPHSGIREDLTAMGVDFEKDKKYYEVLMEAVAQHFPETVPDPLYVPNHELPKQCSCDIVSLMQQGCVCGGK